MGNEIEKEVRTFVTRLYCNCGEEMVIGNGVLMTHPVKYSYYCERCNYTETSFDLYPKVLYEVVSE